MSINWNTPISRKTLLILVLIPVVALAFMTWVPRVKRAFAKKEVLEPKSRFALEEPTADELRRLNEPVPKLQIEAAQSLFKKKVTPEYIEAVRRAKPTGEGTRALLVCLRERFPGPEGIAMAIRNVAEEPKGYANSPESTKFECSVDVLVERATEDPPRIREALLRVLLVSGGGHGLAQRRAEEGLRKIPASAPPAIVLRMYESQWTIEQDAAVNAAFAVGAVEQFPRFVENSLEHRSQRIRNATLWKLSRHPGQRAAQILARAYVKWPEDRYVQQRVDDRPDHHLWMALADIAMDDFSKRDQRIAAIRKLAGSGDKEAAARIRPLAKHSDPAIQAYTEATLKRIEGRF